MDIRSAIVEQYQAFEQFLASVDLNELKKTLSRKDLEELATSLYAIKHRSLPFELRELAASMKKEEFPELNGVCRFPALRQIDFLSETAKVELDKFLVMFRTGNYVQNLYRITSDAQKVKLLESFLVEHGIVEKTYVVTCPLCGKSHLSKTLTEEAFLSLQEQFSIAAIDEDYDALENQVEMYCDDCEDSVELESLYDTRKQQLSHKLLLKMIGQRDTSLDRV